MFVPRGRPASCANICVPLRAPWYCVDIRMVQNTVRDSVWRVAVELAVGSCGAPADMSEVEDKLPKIARGQYDDRGFTKKHVADRVDASDRTVHDVLKTMVEYGLLGSEARRLRHVLAEDNGHGKPTWTHQETTVYYAAGDLATTPVEQGDLIGSSVTTTTDVDPDDIPAPLVDSSDTAVDSADEPETPDDEPGE